MGGGKNYELWEKLGKSFQVPQFLKKDDKIAWSPLSEGREVHREYWEPFLASKKNSIFMKHSRNSHIKIPRNSDFFKNGKLENPINPQKIYFS